MKRYIWSAIGLGLVFGMGACATSGDPLDGSQVFSHKANSLRIEDPDLMNCPKRAEGLMAKYPALIRQASCFTARVPFSCTNDEPPRCESEDRSFISLTFLKSTVVKRYEKTMPRDVGCEAWLAKMEKKFSGTYLISEEVGTDEGTGRRWQCVVHTLGKSNTK